MNERIKDIYSLIWKSLDVTITPNREHEHFGWAFTKDHQNQLFDENMKKFAELIIQECIEQVRAVGDLRGANDDMIYAVDTAAIRLSKHFGIE